MEDREFNYINVIPLVDIMLVLLTIVLTTATFIAQGEIPVNLPEARSAEEHREQISISIHILKEGNLLLRDKKVSLKDLKKELSKLNRSLPVHIRADERAQVGVFAQVIDTLRLLGFGKVSMVVKRP